MQPKTKKLRDTVSFRTVDVLQWCVYAVVVGVVCGTIAAAFGMVIDAATAARQKYDWLVWLMPVAGLAIVGMYHLSGITKPMGTNRVLLAVKEEEGVAIRMAPLIYLSSMLTHLTGGSSGREGAALQIGGSVANFIGRQFKLSHLDLRTITMCGMAAGFSGLFGTPLAAGIFAMEIADGTLHYAVLLPCMLSSIVARVTAEKFGIQAAAFTVTGYPDLTLHSVLAVLVFGVMCALLSILFGTALGFLVFMLCRNGNPVANGITRFCVWLVTGTPMVVLLMILYYIIFGSVAISGIAVAVIGFTLTFGAAVFGLLRMGVGTIDRGQYEAAYALGHSNRHTFFRIILPQAIPHVLPAYQGEIVGLIKATAIVGYIAVQDLTKMGDIVRSRTYEAFFPLIAITVIYFVLEGLFSFAVSRIRISIDPRKRNREKILKGVNLHD